MSGSSYISNLRQIFLRAVESVQPVNLISTSKCLQRLNDENLLKVATETISLAGKKCHLVGFGKAVLGMAVQVERILNERLVSGIISIPVGTLSKFSDEADMKLRKNVIRVYEGAENNLPDKIAMQAAKEIEKLAKSMTDDDILFVLVSGGGSALLPLPVDPIGLVKKTDLIRNLAQRGANIEEINIVRIAISKTKGGKLAEAAKNAHRIFSLVISDIVQDPLHLIASGPTMEFRSDGRTPRDILKKYEIWDNLRDDLKMIFEKPTQSWEPGSFENNFVFLIGSNRVAADAAQQRAHEFGYKSCILSISLVGSLEDLTEKYRRFLNDLYEFLDGKISKETLAKTYPFGKGSFEELYRTLGECKCGDVLCLILAGEPTAHVRGNGKGGRSQELALRLSKVFYEDESLKDATFLSAGTDGIDGPTDAAGAIGSAQVVRSFLKNSHMNVLQDFIDRNDSYNFYKQLDEFHIRTGHTGTNVMDIHLISIPISKRACSLD